MNKKVLAIVCSLSFLLAVGGCKKKEEEPPLIPKTVLSRQQQPVSPKDQVMTPKRGTTGTTVVVPDSVKGKWKGVVIIVEDKIAKKTEEFTVNLNSDFKVPDSDIKIFIGEFLPGFQMIGQTITSISNETTNPAVRVKVFETGKEIFEGWLYSKFPMIHPFDHPKYSILLKNGVKKE